MWVSIYGFYITYFSNSSRVVCVSSRDRMQLLAILNTFFTIYYLEINHTSS
jgi:hypothetical protein